MASKDEDARRRLTRMPPQGAIVAVLAAAGLASSFMFTLVVPIQSKLPELLDASREDTAWVVTSTLLAAADHHADLGPPRRHVRQAADRARAAGGHGGRLGHRRAVAGHRRGHRRPDAAGRDRRRRAARASRSSATCCTRTASTPRSPSSARRSASAGRSACRSARSSPSAATGTCCSGSRPALGVVVFALVLWIVPVSVLRTAGRFDYVGAAGLGVGLIGILLAISRGNEWGWTLAARPRCSGSAASSCCCCGAGSSCASPSRCSTCASPRGAAVLLTNLASVAMGFSLFASNVVVSADARAAGRDGRVRAVAAGGEPHRHARRARDDGALARSRAGSPARSGRSCSSSSARSRSSPPTGSRCSSRPRCGTSSSRTSSSAPASASATPRCRCSSCARCRRPRPARRTASTPSSARSARAPPPPSSARCSPSYAVDVEGMPVPTPAGFQLSFVLGGIAAVVALVWRCSSPGTARRRRGIRRCPSERRVADC